MFVASLVKTAYKESNIPPSKCFLQVMTILIIINSFNLSYLIYSFQTMNYGHFCCNGYYYMPSYTLSSPKLGAY